jgi:hypothetical protein
MKSRFFNKELISLGTYAFEQQFLLANGYTIKEKYRAGGASFVLAAKGNLRVMFLLHIHYQEKIVIDNVKRTKKDKSDLYKALSERAQLQGALAAIAKINLDDNLDRLIKLHPQGKQTILETDKGVLYVSQPIAKLEYRRPYDKH